MARLVRPLVALSLAVLVGLVAATGVLADGDDEGEEDRRHERHERDEDDRNRGDERDRRERDEDDDEDDDEDEGEKRDDRRRKDSKGKDSRDKDKDGSRDKDREDKGEGKRTPKQERPGNPDGRSPPQPASPPASTPLPRTPPLIDLGLTGDAGVRQSVRLEPGRMAVVVIVGGLGAGPATDVRLTAELPDLGAVWDLSGAGSAACTIEGTALRCAFGDLGPGELRLLQVASDVELTPAWQVLAASELEAGNDRQAANDRAASHVGVLLT